MPPLAITDHSLDSAVVLNISGEIDLSNSGSVYTALSKALARGLPVILDMSGVEFLDSRGLASIVQAWQEAAVTEPPTLLTVPSPAVARVVELAGATAILPLFHDRDEALATLTPDPEPESPEDCSAQPV
jgi:anti-sigma B factor antagonist